MPKQAKDFHLKERPAVRNIDDVWCWMNTWGDRDKHGFTHGSAYAIGYERCISDLLKVLEQAGIEDVPNEAWDRWTGWTA